MTIRNLNARTLVFETAADYNNYVAAGGLLERFQSAFLAFATSGQDQWLRGTGAAIGSAEVTQVVGAPGGAVAGYTKAQVTTASAALTWAAHNRRIVHVEALASLAALLAANWKDAGGAYLEGDFYVQNHTGATLTFDVTVGGGTGFVGFVELGGDEQASGFAIPDKYLAHIFVDPDGFVQITLAGEAVTQAELTAGLNLKQDASARVATMTGNVTDDTKYPSAKLVYDHVSARRGTIGAVITASATLAAWDDNRDVDATAGAVVVTLPSAAAEDGEITITRRDNTANVVVVQAAAGQTLLNVPTGTTHVALLPGGSVTFRATAGGPAKRTWALPQSASRLWLPTDLTGLYAWYPASALAGAAGSAIAGWNDQSGNARHMAAVATEQALVSSVLALGGYNVADFDGSNDRMTFTTPGVDWGTTDHLIAMMARPEVNGRDYFGTGGVSDGHALMMINGSVTRGHAWRGATANTVDGATGPALSTWRTLGQRVVGNTIEALLNGAVDGTVAMTGTSGAGVATQMILGSRGTGGTNFDGQLADAIIAHASVSNDDLNRIFGYLAWRYGRSADLAAGHPYSNAPPLQSLVAY